MEEERVIPEYLLKDELIFEVVGRGEVPVSDVIGLRSQLRALLRGDYTLSWKDDLQLEKQLDYCKQQWELLSMELDSWVSERPKGKVQQKWCTRLVHLLHRVLVAKTAPSLKEKEGGFLGTLEAKLREAYQLLMTTAQEGKAGVSGLGVVPEPPIVPKENPELDTEKIPVLQSVVTETHVSPVPNASPALGLGTSQSGLLQYAKLSNPLSPLLQGIRTTDGLDPHNLIEFFGRIINVLETPGVDDKLLLSLLIPLCRSPLSERLYETIRAGKGFDEFHKRSLKFFVPDRVLERLKTDRLYRLQRVGESLAAFSADVRRCCKVLRLPVAEAEVVQIILEGITPEERSRLVFSSRPTTFSELDQLCVVARNIQLTDATREQVLRPRNNRPVMAVQRAPEPVRDFHPEQNFHHGPAQNYRSGNAVGFQPRAEPGRGVICYRCGKAGHIRQNCRRADGVPRGMGGTGGPKNP